MSVCWVGSQADVVQEDLLELLGKAVTCAVLGKAGPQRSRVLGLLHKDERVLSLEQVPPGGSAPRTIFHFLIPCPSPPHPQLPAKTYASHAAVLHKMYLEQVRWWWWS